MLFQPEEHEPLAGESWNEDQVRAGIRAIVADSEAEYDDGWPAHPRDEVSGRMRTIYLGGAGVVDAIRRLADAGLVELRRDYVPYLERSAEAGPEFPYPGTERSLWMGETGIRLVLQRLAPSPENLERLAQLIAANAHDERRELMWGSVGTILAGRELGLDVSESVDWLRGQRDVDGLWTQELYGRTLRYLGPAHGATGCALALGDAAQVSKTLRGFAVAEDGVVNWPAIAGTGIVPADGRIRTQWCHGAPGIVSTLARFLDGDLALAGGNLTWQAGPLRKGAGLCHGTAGNGYALLALFELTGDEEWLVRARAFGMHALPARARSARRGARPLLPLDRRPGGGAVSRRLPRGAAQVAASVTDEPSLRTRNTAAAGSYERKASDSKNSG